MTASRSMKYFMLASYNMMETNEWCEYLDYIKTIHITHSASPEQLERDAALHHFRYDPKQLEKSPIKRRPDHHQTTRAIVSMNKEAGQTQESKRRHDYREDLDPEKVDWLVWLSHNWKWYFTMKQISALESAQWQKKKSMPRETEKHSLMMTGGKQLGGPRPGGRHPDGHEMTMSEVFFFLKKKKTPDFAPTTWHLLCVRRGVYTHSVSHAHFLCVTYRDEHAWLKVFAVRMSYLSISPSPLTCFIRRPCCSRTVTSTLRSRLHLPCRTVPDPKARVNCTSARAAMSLATWPIPRTLQKE